MATKNHAKLQGLRQAIKERPTGTILRACPYNFRTHRQRLRYDAWVRGWYIGRLSTLQEAQIAVEIDVVASE